MSLYIRFAVTAMTVLFSMTLVYTSDTNQVKLWAHACYGSLLYPLLANRSAKDFTISKEFTWDKAEIEDFDVMMWCGMFDRLPNGTKYKFCSQSGYFGGWNCEDAIELYPIDDVKGKHVALCHEHKWVAGTNVAAFVKIPDLGNGPRYLRTESLFVPELKSKVVERALYRRHLFILIGCVSVAAISLCALGYFLYQRHDEAPNEQSQANNEDV